MEENNNVTPEIEAQRKPEVDKLDEFSIANGFKLDDSEYKPQKPKKHKRKKNNSHTAVWILVIIILSFGIAFSVILAGADYLGVGFGRGALGECEITIKQGTSTAEIAEQLKETGAIKSSLLFRLYAKAKHYDGKFRDGFHHFDAEAGYETIANILMQDGAAAKQKRVTIVDGCDVDKIAEILDEEGVCTKEDFLYEVQEGDFKYDFVKQIPVNSVYYRLEGYLYPDTYNFACSDSKESAHLAVDKMLSNLNQKLTNEKIDINNISVMGKYYSFHQVLTMASIVEMESGENKNEMPNVAAVFYNRLASPDYKTLGSSPTRKYPYGDGRYNTYECEGLPVGPLCTSTIDCIKASIEPTKNFDYYYFVTDRKKKFYYNKTISQHNSIITKLKSEENWPDEE